MRALFIVILIALLLALGFAAMIAKDAGYVLLAYNGKAVEMSLAVATILGAGAFIVGYIALRLLSQLAMPSGALSRWMHHRQQLRNQRQTMAGLLAFVEGNWDKSRKILAKSAVRSEEPLINYLMAAKASQAMGARQQSQQFLRQAEENSIGESMAVGLTQAELQLKNGQLEESLATLMRLKKMDAKHPVVLKLLVDAYRGVKDWESLVALLSELGKQKLYRAEDFTALEEEAWSSLLSQVAAKETGERLQALNSIWQKVPAAMKKDSRIVAAYSAVLTTVDGGGIEAEKLLRGQLKRQWDDELVSLYAKAHGEDKARQLLEAEDWLKSRPNNANLLLCLGRLSLANELWGKAREYFETSLKFEPKAETYAELGRLLAHLGEHKKSTDYYQQGLLLSTHGLPQLPQPHKMMAASV